ncbi:ABC transporter permease [Ornithinimicrobium pratense]|uniref:ABC transporter permease n=1 Tax=Ornithinimicrobium pratense TaxID=2593973 RepID=A0A5J6V6T4_9MICO|nr:ABC transporter permease [Ornithinimicrobium pratense]QFG69730.1 ABC transporter permease [Ornithinimicrobium pratense]
MAQTEVEVATPDRRTGRGAVSRGRLVTALPMVMLIALVLAVSVREPTFLSGPSLSTLAESSVPIILLALGQTFVILTGGIDLSVAVLASLGTILLASWIDTMGVAGILLMIACITGAGLLNGVISAYAQIPSFVVTLGAMGLWSGVALGLSGASTISIGENYPLIGWLTGSRFAGVALGFWATMLGVVLVLVLMAFLARGKSLHTIGLAERAALMSGIRTRRVRVLAFGASGFFAAMAAIVLSSSQYSGSPTLADALLLPAIAAVIVGGSAITGGIGGPLRTVVGALIIGVLRVGMSILGVPPAYEQIVYGALIVVAVALSMDRSRVRVVK